ncbi:hypothetical protein FB451DRAFT_1191112 [Mycena latifolia]|nr:hypothetical protein FB451DRAFT_1191112 [Mycena latifolia]
MSDAWQIDPWIKSELQIAQSQRPDYREYVCEHDSHIAYVQLFLRPYAEMIWLCILSGSYCASQLPLGRVDFLSGHSIALITVAALLIVIANEHATLTGSSPYLHPSVSWSLQMVESIDAVLGRPTYGFHEDTQNVFLVHVRAAGALANNTREAGNAMDVAFDVRYSCLPRVPSWNLSRIEELQGMEDSGDLWACELAMAKEEIENAARLGEQLEKASAQAQEGFAPNHRGMRCPCRVIWKCIIRYFLSIGPSGRSRFGGVYKVLCRPGVSSSRKMLRIERSSPRSRPSKRYARLSTQDLVTLTDKIVVVMRDAVKLLLENMKILASASLTYSHYGTDATPLFFVPAEAMVLFAIAEKALDLFGFCGDEAVGDRDALLDNICITQGSLILNLEFLVRPLDFPHFKVRDEHLEKLGIYPFIKCTQLNHFFASSERDRRTFGQRLARYNPHLPPAECYAFENPDKDMVPTEPNTLDGETSLTSPVDWFKVEMERLVAAEEDKENLAVKGAGREGGQFVVDVKDSGGDGMQERIDRTLWPSNENTSIGSRTAPPDDLLCEGRVWPYSASCVKPSSCNPAGDVPLIVQYTPQMERISLSEYELSSFPWYPSESYPVFFENRLRPLVYFLHSAVTHGFTLRGPRGVYTIDEFEAIKYWVDKIVRHCRLVQMGRSDITCRYVDDLAVPHPPTWEVPGEAVAMFEIMYRICLSVGFPKVDLPDMPVHRRVLLPLIVAAWKTKASLRTPGEYYPYDRLGQLGDPDWLHPDMGNVLDDSPFYPAGPLGRRRVFCWKTRRFSLLPLSRDPIDSLFQYLGPLSFASKNVAAYHRFVGRYDGVDFVEKRETPVQNTSFRLGFFNRRVNFPCEPPGTPRVRAVQAIIGWLRIIPEACPDRDSLIELVDSAVFSIAFPLMSSANAQPTVRRSTRPTNPPPTKETGATVKKSGPSGKNRSRRPTTRSDASSVPAGKRSCKPVPDDNLESEDTAESTGDGSSDEDSDADAGEDSPGDGVPATTSGGEDAVGAGVYRGNREYPDPTLPLPRGAISFVISRDLSRIVLPPALTITPLRTRCPLGVRDNIRPPQHYSIRIPSVAQFIQRFDPSRVTYDKEEKEVAQRFREDNWRSGPWGRWILGSGSTPEQIRRSFYHLRISLDAFRFQFVLYRPIHPATLPSDPYDSLYVPDKHPKPVFSFSRVPAPVLSSMSDGLAPSEYEAMKSAMEDVTSLHERGQDKLEAEASRVKVTERWEEAVDAWHAYHEERSALINRTLRSLFQLGLFCRLVYLGQISLPTSAGPPRAPPSMFVQVPPRASSSKQAGSSAADPTLPLIGDLPFADSGDADHLSDSGGSAKCKGKKRKKRKRSRSPQAKAKAKGKGKVAEVDEEGEPGVSAKGKGKGKAVVADEESEPGDTSTYDALAWHVAHDPFSDGDLFNVRGGPLFNHGWNPSLGASPALARGLEPWRILTKVLPGIVFFTRGPGCRACRKSKRACTRIHEGTSPPEDGCNECRWKHHACRASSSEFDWEGTDRQLQLLNAAYTDFVGDWFVEHMSSIAGVNINERMLARCLFRHQMPGYESLGSSSFAPVMPSSAPSASSAPSFAPAKRLATQPFGTTDGTSVTGHRTEAIVGRATSALGQTLDEFMRGAREIGDVVEQSLREAASSPSKEMEGGEDNGTAPSSPLRPREDTSFPMDVSPTVGGQDGGPARSARTVAGPSLVGPAVPPEVVDGDAQMPLAPPLRFGRPVGLEPPSSPPHRPLLAPGPTSLRFNSIPPVTTLNTSPDRPLSVIPSLRATPRPSSIAASTSPHPVLDSPPRVPSPGGPISLPPPPPPRPSPLKTPDPPSSGPSFRAPTPRVSTPVARALSVVNFRGADGEGSVDATLSSPFLPRSELSPDFVRATSTPRISRGRPRDVNNLASPSSPYSIKEEEREILLKTNGSFVDLTGEDVEMGAP